HSSCPPELRNAVSAADVEPRTLAPDLSTALHGRIPAAAIRHSARRSGPASAVRYPIRRIGTPEHDSPQQVASEWIQPRTGAALRAHHSRCGGIRVPGLKFRPGSADCNSPVISSTPASETSCSIHGAWSVPTPWWCESVPPWSTKDCWLADFTTSYCSSWSRPGSGGNANVKYRQAPEW